MSRSSSPSTSHASKPRINSSSPTEKKATSVLRPRQQALDAIAANKGNSKEVVPESVAPNESASAEDKRPSSPDAARILEQEAKETVQTSYPASYNSRSQHDQSSRSWDANKQYGDNRHPNNGPRNNWGYDRYSDNRGLPRNTPTGPREGRRGSSQRSRRRRDHPKHYYPPETLPYDSPSKTGSKRRSPPSYDNERPSKRSSRRDRSSSYGRKRRSRSRDRFRDSSRSPTRSHGYSARDERSSSSRERRRQRSRERSQSRDRRHSPQHLHHPTPYDEQTPYGPHLPDPPTLPEDSVPTPTRNDSQLSLLYPTSPIPAPSEQALADLSILERQLQEERTKCQTMEQELAHYKTQLDTVITRHIQVMENHPTPAMFESDSGTMPKVNFDGPRPEHTIPQEHGTAMADGRGEEELSEIAGLRQQLVDIRAELQETKDALDARTLELRGSNAFLTRADSSSNSDCIRLVEALNHEIEQTCASIADSVTIEKDQPPDPTALTDAEAFVLESYGQPLLSYMCRNRESHDHGLTQYVLTHSLVKRCYSLLSLWSWNPQDSKSIEAVYNGLKAASSESLTIEFQGMS